MIRSRKYTKAPIFFTTINYGALQPIDATTAKVNQVILFHGLANGSSFEDYLSSHYEVRKSFTFKDHHNYSEKDLLKVVDYWKSLKDKNVSIITTEKDMVKITGTPLELLLKGIPFYYLPIQVSFSDQDTKKAFDDLVVNAINSKRLKK